MGVRLLRLAFFALIVRPVIGLLLGVHARRRHLLPRSGPAVIIANHNSHLDTLTLMAMFPLRLLPKVRPVAAMDYFVSSGLFSWFALNIIGILPIVRGGRKEGENPLQGCIDALDRGEILILFPEGSRGAPEEMAEFKKGLAHLARARPDASFAPVFMHGLGKALPKGSCWLIPFNLDVFFGEPIHWTGSIDGFVAQTEMSIRLLAAEGDFPRWS